MKVMGHPRHECETMTRMMVASSHPPRFIDHAIAVDDTKTDGLAICQFDDRNAPSSRAPLNLFGPIDARRPTTSEELNPSATVYRALIKAAGLIRQ